MQTVLEAIKTYPNAFICCAGSRSSTTPSEHNKALHMQLRASIEASDWDAVKIVLLQYESGTLEGLIYALHYTQCAILSTEITHIARLFKVGAIV